MPAAPARSHPEPPAPPDHAGRRAAWWQRHEALLQVTAAVAVVGLLTMTWWRVAGSKPAAEDALLTDRDGRPPPDLALLPPALRDAVNRTLREGRLQFAPVPAELQARGGEPRPAPAAFLPLAPVGVMVRSRQLTLRWTSCAGATGYVVRLRPRPLDPAGPASPELPGTRTEWTPPEPLVPGATYTWQVEARRDDDEPGGALGPRLVTPETCFQVLDEARGRELDDVARRFGRFPLIMAVALARAGLADEAAGRLAELTREHPQSNAALRLQRGAEATRMRARELER